jgi:hypothetical protein
MRNLLLALFIFFPFSMLANEYKPMEGYSTAPLAEPIFDHPKVVVDTTNFNNWLNANYSKLAPQDMKGPREHLYYLLSSYVSELHRRDGIILPVESDLVISTLLSWSERLGAYGGNLFYNKVKTEEQALKSPFMKVSESIKLSAVNDMYLVESSYGNWSAKFPYYFMIGAINEFKATNGMDTQIVTISTGGVKDNTPTGRSQSTIMVVYTSSTETKEFQKYWLNAFEIGAAIEPKPLDAGQLESQYVYNEEALLHKEVAFLPSPNGSLLVAYLGMDGAYQRNRLHFLDFLMQVKTATLLDDMGN